MATKTKPAVGSAPKPAPKPFDKEKARARTAATKVATIEAPRALVPVSVGGPHRECNECGSQESHEKDEYCATCGERLRPGP